MPVVMAMLVMLWCLVVLVMLVAVSIEVIFAFYATIAAHAPTR